MSNLQWPPDRQKEEEERQRQESEELESKVKQAGTAGVAPGFVVGPDRADCAACGSVCFSSVCQSHKADVSLWYCFFFKDQTATLRACRMGCLKMGDPGIPQNPVVYQHFLHPKCHDSGYLTILAP